MNKVKSTKFAKKNLSLIVTVVAGVIAILAIFSYASFAGAYSPQSAIYIDRQGNTYTAYTSLIYLDVEPDWIYIIRSDDTCEGSVFQDNTADNLTSKRYSNSFAPISSKAVSKYDGQYICFTARLGDGGWAHQGHQLELFQAWISHEEGSNIYAANSVLSVRRWKYVIRNDDTCNGSIFSNGGRDQGNFAIYHDADSSPVYVVYHTNEFDLAGAGPNAAAVFDGQYICFNAFLTDSTWYQVGAQLSWTPGAEIADWYDIYRPGSPSELTGYIEGYLQSGIDNNEGLWWQNAYETFEEFVITNQVDSLACYRTRSGDLSAVYGAAADGVYDPDIPQELYDFINDFSGVGSIPGYGPDVLREEKYFTYLKHQVITDQGTNICKYNIISSDLYAQNFFFVSNYDPALHIWDTQCADHGNPPPFGPIPTEAWCTEDDTRTVYDPGGN